MTVKLQVLFHSGRLTSSRVLWEKERGMKSPTLSCPPKLSFLLSEPPHPNTHSLRAPGKSHDLWASVSSYFEEFTRST